MQKLRKNVVLEGIFSAESPDTSGEVLIVRNADISSLNDGTAFVNTEHINPSDLDKKDENDKKDKDFKGFQSIVGKVLGAKKIFGEKDCESDRELGAWNAMKVPMIYGRIEIFDGPEAHDNAKAAASIARMLAKDSDTKLGLSVEGSTLEREGKLLKRTVIRNMALTLKPAFKGARVDLVKDTRPSDSPEPVLKSATQDGIEPLYKSVDMNLVQVYEPAEDYGLSRAVQKLRKALTAGSPNAAPSSLTQGAALQSQNKESELEKIWKACNHKAPSKEALKKMIPSLTDSQAEKIEKALKKKALQKAEAVTSAIYKKFTGNN